MKKYLKFLFIIFRIILIYMFTFLIGIPVYIYYCFGVMTAGDSLFIKIISIAISTIPLLLFSLLENSIVKIKNNIIVGTIRNYIIYSFAWIIFIQVFIKMNGLNALDQILINTFKSIS